MLKFIIYYLIVHIDNMLILILIKSHNSIDNAKIFIIIMNKSILLT